MTVALRSFGELVMRHRGARICVMGGGPSLAADVAKVAADVWISTNDHGAKLRPVDYVVAMDNLHTVERVQMGPRIRKVTDAPIIGPWQWSDYGLTNYPLAPTLVFSGVIAQWIAAMMGGHPVIMAGFDCTGNARKAIAQHTAYKPHVRCESRVVSGPLIGLWPAYDPAEVLGPYVPPEVFVESEHGIYVRVVKPVELRGQTYPIGTVLNVPRAEVHRQIKHRSLVEVDPPSKGESPDVTTSKPRNRRPPARVASKELALDCVDAL